MSDTHARRRLGGAILGVAVGVLVVLLMVLLVRVNTLTGQIRETQKTTSPLVAKIDRSSRRIRSCTTPGRPCYEQGQAQTAKAVGDIIGGNVAAMACARQVPPDQTLDQTIESINRCLRDLAGQ